jgi:hypothetical protein
MKVHTVVLAAVVSLFSSFAIAQNNGSGSQPGAVTADPAASSQSGKRDTTGMATIKSGSGTSTLGGSDANGDQGRDTKPSTTVPHPTKQ